MRDKPPNASARTKRRLLFTGAVAVVVLAAAFIQLLANRGPSYRGKSIEYWFKKSTPGDSNSRQSPEARAFQDMGPAVVPFLRKMLQEETWWEGFYRRQYFSIKLRAGLPPSLTAHLPAPMLYGYRQQHAAMMLGFIGPPAKAAASDLIEAYKIASAKAYNLRRNAITNWASPTFNMMYSISPKVLLPTGRVGVLFSAEDQLRITLIHNLGEIGGTNEEIVPIILGAMRDTNGEIRAAAKSAIQWGHLAEAANVSTVALLEALKDPDEDVSSSAAHLLELTMAENVKVIPTLIKYLGDPDAKTRARAIGLLIKPIGERVATPRLIEALDSTNTLVRGAAARILGTYGTVAGAAVPKLAELVKEGNEPDTQIRCFAAEALWRIDQQLRPLIPFRIAELKNEREGIRWDAASFLGECGSEASSAVPDLVEMLRNDSKSRLRARAATALGQIGPDAKTAIPALKRALQDESQNVRDAAAEALKKIDPAGAER
jgi:HEAT repeat protein